ncbi:MAG: lecithin retinol acyltransferase family protein [Aeromonas sp.]
MPRTSPSQRPRVPALQPGDHLLSRRRGFKHHGIYLGQDQVIHYAGLADGFKGAPIEICSLADFAGHDGVANLRSKAHPHSPFSREQILARARSRLGEDSYHALSNNCEHFCNWCIDDRHHSTQAQIAASVARSALRLISTRWKVAGIVAELLPDPNRPKPPPRAKK